MRFGCLSILMKTCLLVSYKLLSEEIRKFTCLSLTSTEQILLQGLKRRGEGWNCALHGRRVVMVLL